MSKQLIKLDLFRNDMKFSAAHFTIFSKSKRERLHGHNYYVKASITSSIGNNGLTYDYRLERKKIKKLCSTLNEYLLLPGHSPYLNLLQKNKHTHVTFNKETMIIPNTDIRIMPLRNISSEELAFWFVKNLTKDKKNIQKRGIVQWEVSIATTEGQTSKSKWSIEHE